MSHILAKPKHMFSWGYDLFIGNELLTTMDVRWLSYGGSFCWDDVEYRLGREGRWSGDFFISNGNTTIAEAIKTSPFPHRFLVSLSIGNSVLSGHPFTRVFQLKRDEGIVGEIRPKHILTRHCTIQLPDELCIQEQVFVFWLAVLMWRRSSRMSE